MWQLSTFVLCFQLAVCGVSSQEPAAAPQLAASDLAPLQEQPQPPGDKPQVAPEEKGKKTGGPRIEGGRISMGPPEEEIKPPTGPMRVELFMLTEERVRYEGEAPPEHPAESSLRLHVKLTGERLAEMVGLGHLVIAEMIDDTGTVLASPEDTEASDERATSPIKSSKRLLARGFVNRSARAKAPSRDARTISKVSGWVNVIYATETEQILIDNPLQYLGGCIEHPRLKALDMKIRVIAPGDEINPKRDGRGVALQFEGSRKKIRQIEFFDAWLKSLYPRSRTAQTPDGENYIYYGSVMGAMDADTQMLLTVYPQIEEEKVRFEFKDVKLP